MKKIIFTILIAIFLFLAGPTLAKISNDPYYYQWAYDHTKVFDAWNYTVGSQAVVVAVIDNGFDTFHPDLRGNVWKNKAEIRNNNKDDDNNGYVDDVWGWNFVDDNNNPRPQVSNLTTQQKKDQVFSHGTLVAGLIGAVGDNDKDGAGINWQVKLMNLKVIGNTGFGSVQTLPKAIRYAVDNGADIINVSMVGSESSEEIIAAVDYAFENDVAMFAAMGNGLEDLDETPLYPVCADANSTIEKILGVTAIDETHHLSTFSNTGTSCVDITAPGQEMNSLLRYSPVNDLRARYGYNWSGTSFSTPLVSGAAALIKSLHPEWGPTEIYHNLTSTVHHTPGQDEVVYANLFGAGLLQIDKAVLQAYRDKPQLIAGAKQRLLLHSTEQRLIKNFATNKDEIVPTALQAIEKVVKWQEDGRTYYATLEALADNYSRIIIFNQDWALVRTWQLPGQSWDMTAGDVNGDGKGEIILVPHQASQELARVYNTYGRELKRLTQDNYHQGVSAAVIDKSGIKDDGLALLYKKDGHLVISLLNNEFEEIKEIQIKDISGQASLAIGDIDGDSELEYVVAAGVGQLPTLIFYEADGKLKRRFWSYDSAYRGGLNLALVDYDDKDGLEVVIAPKSGLQPVRVWNYRVKKLVQWYPFGEDNLLGIDLSSY